jgi:ferredoxin
MNRCESHRQCVFAAPEVFSFDDEDCLTCDSTPDSARRTHVEKAAGTCPVRAISVSADAS